MNTYQPTAAQPGAPRPAGFTLIEMIVVTGIIAILAALIFPITASLKKARDLSRARAELMVVAHAIDGYKDKLGHYPPDNAVAGDALHYAHSPLFYELRGTTAVMANGTVTAFNTLDGSASITPANVSAAFGIGGFVNCTRTGGDEGQPAQKFLPDLIAGQYGDATFSGVTCRLLGCSLDGPLAFAADPTSPRKFNPWSYNCSSPTNNPNSYDLWVDVTVGSKTYRINNWSTTGR